VQISDAGYSLHGPELDEDIGIAGLLIGKQSTASAASFEQRKLPYKLSSPAEEGCGFAMLHCAP
jgi:hypothetical protein